MKVHLEYRRKNAEISLVEQKVYTESMILMANLNVSLKRMLGLSYYIYYKPLCKDWIEISAQIIDANSQY